MAIAPKLSKIYRTVGHFCRHLRIKNPVGHRPTSQTLLKKNTPTHVFSCEF